MNKKRSLNKIELIVISLISLVVLGTFVVSRTLAEQSGSSPDSGTDSVLTEIYDELVTMGFGTEDGSRGTLWNRIYNSAIWVPNTGITAEDVVEGVQFYEDGRNAITGTASSGVDYEKMSLAQEDYRDNSASAYWPTWVETNTAPVVWKDERTELYWSAQQSSATTNSFSTGCDFYTEALRGDYDGSDPNCGNSVNRCATLSLDANDDGTDDTKWYLPSQPEFMQAYLDGISYETENSWILGSGDFWTSTQLYGDSSRALASGIILGRFNHASKTGNYYVRCVLRYVD